MLCPSSSTGLGDPTINADLRALWGQDPVHLNPAGYSKIAEALVKHNESIPGPASKTPAKNKEETTAKKVGISLSDTTASRWDRDERGHNSSGHRRDPSSHISSRGKN